MFATLRKTILLPMLMAAGAIALIGWAPRTEPVLPPISRIGADPDSLWRADLAALRAGLVARHPKPWHLTSEARFDSALAVTLPRLRGAPLGIAAVELARIMALVGDAHTGLDIFPTARLGLRALPIRFEVASDGVVVTSAAPAYASLVGTRLLKIGRTSVEEAIGRLVPFLPHENEMAPMARMGISLGIPELLQVAGLIPLADTVSLTFDTSSGVRTVTVAAIAPFPGGLRGVPTGWTGLPAIVSVPKPGTGAFWMTATAGGVFYVRIDAIGEDSTATFGRRIASALTAAHAADARAVALDLRFNGGGDNTLLPGAIRAIVQDTSYDRRDRLFVLVGRRTASAAANFTELLRTYTQATFVGEATGAPPNHYGDAVDVPLPHSGLRVRVATVWWQFDDPRSTRTALRPSTAAPFTMENYRRGTDPGIDSVRALSMRPPQ